jgi:hypothetical protein
MNYILAESFREYDELLDIFRAGVKANRQLVQIAKRKQLTTGD